MSLPDASALADVNVPSCECCVQLWSELVAVPAHTNTPRLAKAEHFLLLGDWADLFLSLCQETEKERVVFNL